jgi:hypothetical protein
MRSDRLEETEDGVIQIEEKYQVDKRKCQSDGTLPSPVVKMRTQHARSRANYTIESVHKKNKTDHNMIFMCLFSCISKRSILSEHSNACNYTCHLSSSGSNSTLQVPSTAHTYLILCNLHTPRHVHRVINRLKFP